MPTLLDRPRHRKVASSPSAKEGRTTTMRSLCARHSAKLVWTTCMAFAAFSVELGRLVVG